jgi:hypothetical protein
MEVVMRLSRFAVLSFVSVMTISLARAAEPADGADKTKHGTGAPDRFWQRGPSVAELKKDLDLTDDQVAKAKDAVDTVKKAFDAKPEVMAAEEEVKKTDEAYKAAEAKLRALKEGNMYLDDLKKALLNSLPDDKKEKAMPLIHIKGAPKAPAEKKDAPKADAPKTDDGGGMNK